MFSSFQQDPIHKNYWTVLYNNKTRYAWNGSNVYRHTFNERTGSGSVQLKPSPFTTKVIEAIKNHIEGLKND